MLPGIKGLKQFFWFWLLVFTCYMNGCSRVAEQNLVQLQDNAQTMLNNNRVMRWYPAADPKNITGVALAVHGLNFKPARMESVINFLNEAGIEVLNVSLRGHGQNYDHEAGTKGDEARLEAFKTVSYELWLDEVRRAFDRARKRSDRKKAPLFFVGYSLGGLLGADLLASNPDVYFDKMVLLAPAMDLHAIHNFVRLLSPFPRLVVPSLSSELYRANDGTPMAAYNALFSGMGRFKKSAGPKLNIPTVVFIDPQDELVSSYGLERLVASKRLDQWKFHLIHKEPNIKGRMRHLIVDEPSVGKKTWNEMRKVMIDHLFP
jgi:esterase/lipase